MGRRLNFPRKMSRPDPPTVEDSPKDDRATWNDWLVVLLLTGAMFFSFVDRLVLSVLVEPIRHDLELTDGQFGLLNGIAFGIFYAVMGVPLGRLSDRWSRTKTIMLSIGIWSFGTAISGLSSSFAGLLMARIAVGAGEAGLSPASYSLIRDRFPQRLLSRALSVFQIGAMLGAGTALIVAGAVYTYFAEGAAAGQSLLPALKPWQLTFLAVSLPGVLFIAAIAMVREAPIKAMSVTLGNSPSLVKSLWLGKDVYVSLFIGMSGIVATTYGLLSWVPAILSREFDWDPLRVGIIYGAVVTAVSPCGVIIGGYAADYLISRGLAWSYSFIAALAASIALPAAVGLALSPTASACLTSVAILHFALCLPVGVIPAYLQTQAHPCIRGQISAAYIMVINLVGLGMGPVAIGYLSNFQISDPVGLRKSLVMVVLPLLCLSTLMLWRLTKRLMRKRHNQQTATVT